MQRRFLFNTLKLLELAEVPRKELQRGNITPMVAFEIARLGEERLQLSATKAILAGSKDGPMPHRAAQKLLKTKFRGKDTAAETQPAAVDADALARRTVDVLLNSVGDVVGRRAQLEDADLRLMLIALGGEAKELAQVRGAQLRVRLVTTVLRNWVQPGSDAEKAVAKAYGLQLGEMTKTARALMEAEGLFEPRVRARLPGHADPAARTLE